tara:strand:+ start:7545 stop:8576 length:1032 start_codon:yes stop_codon:yes gene_type:complete
MGLLEDIKDAVKDIVKAVVDPVKSNVSTIKSDVKTALNRIANIADDVEDLQFALSQVDDQVAILLLSTQNYIEDVIVQETEDALSAVLSEISDSTIFIIDEVGQIIDDLDLETALTVLQDIILLAIIDAKDVILSGVDIAVTGAVDILSTILGNYLRFLINNDPGVDSVWEFINLMFEVIVEAPSNIIKSSATVVNAISTTSNRLSNTLNTVLREVIETYDLLEDGMREKISNLRSNLIRMSVVTLEGISNITQNTMSGLVGIATTAFNTILALLDFVLTVIVDYIVILKIETTKRLISIQSEIRTIRTIGSVGTILLPIVAGSIMGTTDLDKIRNTVVRGEL